MNPAQTLFLALLRIYRFAISPLLAGFFSPLGFGCRFTPTCSRFAMEAVAVHGAIKGSWLATRRICRCHPWGGSGEDLVPPKFEFETRPTPLNRCRNGS